MPKYRITSPDGRTFEVTAPEGASQEQVMSYVQQQTASMPKSAATQTNPSKGKGGIAGGAFMGAIRDPLDAGAQLLTRGVSTVASLGGRFPNAVSQWADEETARVDQIVKNANAEYDQSREMAGREGFDVARLAGNVVSPANAAIAARIPLAGAVGAKALAVRGAAQGAASGMMQPVTDTENFGTQKAIQMGAGAVGGAVITPVAAKVGEKAVQAGGKAYDRIVNGSQFSQAQVRQIDDFVNQALAQNGIKDLSEVPEGIIRQLRQQAGEALKAGQKLDPAAALRKADFDRLQIPGTTGQITRDPMQYAKERNLRGIEGVGQELTDRFAQQNQLLSNRLADLGAGNALEADVAGSKLVNALQKYDEPKKQAVSAAYAAARDEAGRYANVDVPGFSKAANDALDSKMLGRFLPTEVRDLVNDISSGKLPLNVNNLVQVDGVMSAAQRAAQRRGDEAAAHAIGEVRTALNNAGVDSNAGAQAKAAFDAARGLARERFAAIDSNPALKAALEGADPDKFVRNHLLNGSTKQVNRLAQLLEADPEAHSVARSQIAGYLRDKAFGANVTGDKPFAQESYNKALKDLGTNKLSAFFTPDEVDQLKAIGRVGGYISSQPAGSAVNNSNTAGAAMNILSNLSGKVGSYPGLNLLRDSVRTYSQEKFAQNALMGQLPKQAAELPPEAKNRLLSLLAPLPIGFASAVGSPSQ